jgi:cobalt-zinc-cadmium efflux system membrane fusion protein
MDPTAPNMPPGEEKTPGPAPPAPHTRRPIGLAAVIAVLALAGVGVLAFRGASPPPAAPLGFTVEGGAVELGPAAAQWRYIELASAASSAALPPVPAPGRITVDEGRSAPIFAPLPGRVEMVNVQLGQEVKPGDKLLALRSSTLPELEREEESARAALAVKSALAERVRDLVQLRAVPEKDLMLAEQERREAELNLKAAAGKRRSLRVGTHDDSGLYWVSATRRGTVVERRALAGMEVGPDRSDPLLSVADLDEVIVVADLLERDAAGIAIGQKASVTDVALGGLGTEGRVEYVAQMVDPVRRTVAVRVRVPNPKHLLRPNAFAQVTFGSDASGGAKGSAPAERHIVVPSEAVVTDDQRSVVFVRQALPGGKTRLERREVQTGRVRDGRTEVLSGLSEGESFVARGALLLLNALDLAS